MNTAQAVFLVAIGLPLAVYGTLRVRAPKLTPDVEFEIVFLSMGVLVAEFVIFVACTVFMLLGGRS